MCYLHHLLTVFSVFTENPGSTGGALMVDEYFTETHHNCFLLLVLKIQFVNFFGSTMAAAAALETHGEE